MANGLRGVSRRKFVVTTERDPRARPASDLVDRNFYADAPKLLWVADITYVPTWAGFLYLAVVLDAFSRRIIGWAMGNDQKAQLVIDAMNMALDRRRWARTNGASPATPRTNGGQGLATTQAQQRDPSQRPGIAIHVGGPRATLHGNGRPSIHGIRRRLLRQRNVRELPRHA